jgi:hypothetical protein
MELLVRKIVLLPYLALLLAACGGGGGDGGGSGGGGTTPTSYTISGKVSVVDNSTLDGDTNDPTATYTPNDTFATAQTISTPTLVVGHMTKKNEGPAGPNRDLGDLSDVYRVSLQAGQVIELEFAEDLERLVDRRQSLRMHQGDDDWQLFCGCRDVRPDQYGRERVSTAH